MLEVAKNWLHQHVVIRAIFAVIGAIFASRVWPAHVAELMTASWLTNEVRFTP